MKWVLALSPVSYDRTARYISCLICKMEAAWLAFLLPHRKWSESTYTASTSLEEKCLLGIYWLLLSGQVQIIMLVQCFRNDGFIGLCNCLCAGRAPLSFSRAKGFVDFRIKLKGNRLVSLAPPTVPASASAMHCWSQRWLFPLLSLGHLQWPDLPVVINDLSLAIRKKITEVKQVLVTHACL